MNYFFFCIFFLLFSLSFSQYLWENNEDLIQPETLLSENGIMNSPISVEYYTRNIANLDIIGCNTITTRSYNQQMPGPTIRVKKGDRIAPLFTNNANVEENQVPSDWPLNLPHELTKTNLHVHGLHVFPGTNNDGSESDNILITIEPGESVQYDIHIPDNHPSGTFWYHPHSHSAVFASLLSGMAGMIIIEDEPNTMPQWISNANERVLIFQNIFIREAPLCDDLQVDYNNPPTSASIDNLFGNNVHHQSPFFLLNGQYQPIIRMRPGQVERWRLLDAMADDFIPLAFDHVNETTTKLPSLRIIARDGITLQYPEIPFRKSGNPMSGPVVHDTAYDQRFRIGPGNRLDIMIQAPLETGSWIFHSTGAESNIDPNEPVERPIFAYLIVEGDPVENMEFPDIPTSSNPVSPLPAGYGDGKLYPETLIDRPISRKPVISYSVCTNSSVDVDCQNAWKYYEENTGDIKLANPLFLVGGPDSEDSGGRVKSDSSIHDLRTFNPERIDHCMALDSVEEWTICNPTGATHPFHLHTNAFEVININGVELSLPDPHEPGIRSRKWLDTVGVPAKRLRSPTDFGPWPCVDWTKDSNTNPPDTLPGYVILRTEVIDFTGFIVQHCHVIKHEDLGMMQMIEIYDPNDNQQTIIPGTNIQSRCTLPKETSTSESTESTKSSSNSKSNSKMLYPTITLVLLILIIL